MARRIIDSIIRIFSEYKSEIVGKGGLLLNYNFRTLISITESKKFIGEKASEVSLCKS
ncbi:MAG: hypothetical protein WDO15_00050 [Bacteroidota bacterium]